MSSGGPPHVERRAAAAATDDRVARISDALGAANLAGGLFQAYPAGGGTSQTAINDGAGARTQVAELVTAAMAVLTLTLLASLLADLAQPILGAIVLVAAIGLVNLAPLRRIRSVRQRDFRLGLVAMAGVLTLSSTTPGSWPSSRSPACWSSGPRGGCSSPTPAAWSTASAPSWSTSSPGRGWCCWT